MNLVSYHTYMQILPCGSGPLGSPPGSVMHRVSPLDQAHIKPHGTHSSFV